MLNFVTLQTNFCGLKKKFVDRNISSGAHPIRPWESMEKIDIEQKFVRRTRFKDLLVWWN